MNYKKSVSVFNGNGKRYTLGIPTLYIAQFGNDMARERFEKNTGLKLVKKFDYYETKPKSFKQLYKVFLTYNWQTTYYNNASFKNTLFLAHNPHNPKPLKTI